jgi:Domain of unknown function (DUF1707)
MSELEYAAAGPAAEHRVRVGDAERQQAAMALGEHFAAGRLDHQEFDDRVRAAYGARTGHDLQLLFGDLPGPPPVKPARWAGSAGSAGVRRSRRPRALVPLLLVVTLLISAGSGIPLFPFVVLGLVLARCAGRARRGPRRDAHRVS